MATVPERFQLRTEPVNEKRFVAVFILAAVTHVLGDPVTTWLAHAYAGGSELNPVLRPALQAGPVAFALIHIPVIILTIAGGAGLVYFIRQADPPRNRQIARLGEVGFALATVWGLLLMANNLTIVLSS